MHLSQQVCFALLVKAQALPRDALNKRSHCSGSLSQNGYGFLSSSWLSFSSVAAVGVVVAAAVVVVAVVVVVVVVVVVAVVVGSPRAGGALRHDGRRTDDELRRSVYPFELRSDCRETSAMRVSDDLQISIF